MKHDALLWWSAKMTKPFITKEKKNKKEKRLTLKFDTVTRWQGLWMCWKDAFWSKMLSIITNAMLLTNIIPNTHTQRCWATLIGFHFKIIDHAGLDQAYFVRLGNSIVNHIFVVAIEKPSPMPLQLQHKITGQWCSFIGIV